MKYKKRIKQTPELIKLIIDTYNNQQRKSANEISIKLNCSPSFIINTLRRNNIEIIKTGFKPRTYSLDEHYFDELNSANKCYFLGLMASDGTVDISQSSYFSLELTNKDKYLVEEFAVQLKTNRPLQIIHKENPNHSDSTRLPVNSKKLVKNLIRYGIVPKKSLILEPIMFDYIPNEFIFDFIRGYFDGDGCVLCKDKTRAVIEILGTFNICKHFENLFSSYGINCSTRKLSKRNNSNTYRVSFGSKSSVAVFFNLIYQNDNCIKMQRKYDKFIGLGYSLTSRLFLNSFRTD